MVMGNAFPCSLYIRIAEAYALPSRSQFVLNSENYALTTAAPKQPRRKQVGVGAGEAHEGLVYFLKPIPRANSEQTCEKARPSGKGRARDKRSVASAGSRLETGVSPRLRSMRQRGATFRERAAQLRLGGWKPFCFSQKWRAWIGLPQKGQRGLPSSVRLLTLEQSCCACEREKITLNVAFSSSRA